MRIRSLGFVNAMAVVAAFMAAGLEKHAVFGSPFTTGNLAVFRAASNTANNTSGSIVELDTTTPAQSPSNIIAIPATDPNGLKFSGSASSTGYLSHTDDRSLLTFNGARSTSGSNVNGLNPRGVGTLDSSGTYALQTTYSGNDGSPAPTNQTRSSTSLDNANWFIGDQGGLYTNGSTSASTGSAPSPTVNLRGMKAFGGTVYAFVGSGGVPAVNTISTPTSTSISPLPGLPNNPDSPNNFGTDFYLVQSGVNGSSYDVLYTTAPSANNAGVIAKYSLVSGSWTANGTYTTNFGGFGLAAQDDGVGADLFLTEGLGAMAANRVMKLFDAGDYNQPIDITTANNVTLYTAPAGTTLKGIDFTPISVPEPGTFALLVMGSLFPALRRRHN